MKTPALLALSILLIAMSFPPASAFIVPERLVYDVSWAGMRMGSAVLEVAAQGEELQIVNRIRSKGFVSSLFHIDDVKESVVSAKGRPKFFRENINEGGYRAHREATFDFDRLRAHSRDRIRNSAKSDAISARTYDSLSSIYYIRFSDLVPGKSILFDIYDTKRLWNTEVRVVKRQEIATPRGKFKTIMVTSQLKHDGVPAKVGNGKFWFTDDSRRIPVKITTQMKVGEITLTLVDAFF